jgi:uncharacterized membrane-anchored protein YjiN (DUF445 family)
VLDSYEVERTKQLGKMRIIATSLLVFMALLYVVSRIFEHRLPFLKFVTAFAEAGIIGALADWFAVVALFKHPLGIPLWHTAIITTKKSEISRTLAHFVVENFLTRKIINEKIAHYDLSANAGSLLIDNTELVTSKVIDAIPALFGILNDKDIQNLLHEQLSMRLNTIKLAPLAGEILEMLTSHERYHDLFNEVIHAVRKIARENKTFMTKMVKAEIPLPDGIWGLEKLKNGIAHWLSGKISDKIRETTKELENDPSHELRKSFEKQVKKTIHDLKHSPEFAGRGDQILRTILEHPAIKDYILGLWSDIKNLILRDANKPDSAMKKQLSGLITEFANHVLMEEPFKSRINDWIREKLLAWVEKYKGEVSNTIIKTVENWKDEEIVRKLELSVGKDLQYIRLNGTIVGGLAGVALFSMYQGVLFFGSYFLK